MAAIRQRRTWIQISNEELRLLVSGYIKDNDANGKNNNLYIESLINQYAKDGIVVLCSEKILHGFGGNTFDLKFDAFNRKNNKYIGMNHILTICL